MKKVFTLALVMAIAVTGFAQVKSMRQTVKDVKSAQAQTFRGFEGQDVNMPVVAAKSIIARDAEDPIEMSQSYYDWQSNMGPRNYVAVWPDGYAVMCYTQATNASYSDRGTGLAIWDPAVGSWEFTETRVEGVKTGFGSIARYKENGLIVAAHTASDCRIFIVENFREGNRDFGEGIAIPTDGENGRTQDPCWPVVQCSGEDLDIVHIITTEYSLTDPMPSALLYTRYEGGEFTVHNHIIPKLDADHMTDGGSNICYFMLYNPERPNRVSFILNNAWSDGKLVISEDNGATWGERVFYQHPNINGDFTDDWFFYPRWSNAEFDANDNLHVVYEWNGTTGTAGSGSYYPAVGGIGYWSEILPKNALCVGGIGNVGEPFIMDSAYMFEDMYAAAPYWSDATHDPIPENIGFLHCIDNDGNVLDWNDQENWPDEYHWVSDTKDTHGSYNGGVAAFATMHMEGDRIFAFYSMVAGDESMYYDDSNSGQYYRLFFNMSEDGGNTWRLPKQVLTDFMNDYEENVYCQVIPYLYNDSEGEYLWLCYQSDGEIGTFVQEDETVPDNNFYHAAKVYLHKMGTDETVMTVETTMNVYPNPAKGSFTVQLSNASDVNIYNTVGQLVKTYENVSEVRVNNLEAGIYFVNAGKQTTKVVVK